MSYAYDNKAQGMVANGTPRRVLSPVKRGHSRIGTRAAQPPDIAEFLLRSLEKLGHERIDPKRNTGFRERSPEQDPARVGISRPPASTTAAEISSASFAASARLMM